MDSIGIQVASQNQTVDDHFHNSNGRKGAWLWPTPTQDWYRRSIMWNFFGMGLVTGCYKDSLDGWISKTTANLVLTPRLPDYIPYLWWVNTYTQINIWTSHHPISYHIISVSYLYHISTPYGPYGNQPVARQPRRSVPRLPSWWIVLGCRVALGEWWI